MFFQINGLEISALEKAREGIISVEIIANHLTEDVEGETLLKSAFDKDTVKTFLETGVIDYFHKSQDASLTDEERADAILGKPTGFEWKNGKPTVYADLTEGHPLVQKMLPHLKVNQPVYGGSVGGSKMVLKVKDSFGQPKSIVPRIKWNHLAIAPSNSVVNREPGVNVRILQKARDLMIEFDDMNAFKAQGVDFFDREEALCKALLAPASAGDLYNTPGGVLTEQSLEKSISNLTFDEGEALLLVDTIIGVKDNNVPMQREALNNYFELKGMKDYGDKFYRLIDKYFNLKGATL